VKHFYPSEINSNDKTEEKLSAVVRK